MNSPLNKHQERRLTVTLYLVEQGLDVIGAYVRNELPRGEMYQTVSDLSIGERNDLLRRLADAKSQIARVKIEFHLEATTNDARGIIMGYLSSLWESLHNARPRNLAGFGTVAPELYQSLDPRLMRIIEHVNSMLDVVTRNRR